MCKRPRFGLALLSIVLAVGCGCSAANQPAAPTGNAPDGAATPKVNRLVLAFVAPSTEGYELRNMAQPAVWQLRPMYEYPIGMDPETGKLAPQLATDWALEPDGRSIRMNLRAGIPFHNAMGTFGAKDIVHGWKDVTSPGSLHGLTQYNRDTVQDIETVSETQVVYHLKQPDALFIRAISEAESSAEVRSKLHYDKIGPPTFQTGPVAGTGPYQYVESKQGANLVYRRVASPHWRLAPDFPELEYRWVQEASTRMAALLANEVHATSLPQDLLRQAEQGGFKTIRGKVPGLRVFLNLLCCYLNDPADPSKGYMFPNGPLMAVRVRKALNKAVDRDGLNKALFGGKGETMYLNHFHPTRPGWDPSWQQRFAGDYGYDAQQARAILQEAGYGPSNPLPLSIISQPNALVSGADDVLDAVGNNWRSIGVNVSFVQMNNSQAADARRQLKSNNHVDLTATSAHLFIGIGIYNTPFSARGRSIEDPVVDDLYTQVSALSTKRSRSRSGGGSAKRSTNATWMSRCSGCLPKPR